MGLFTSFYYWKILLSFCNYWKILLSGLRDLSQWSSDQLCGLFKNWNWHPYRRGWGCRLCKGLDWSYPQSLSHAHKCHLYHPVIGDHGVCPVHVLVDQGFVLLRQRVLGDPPRGFFLRENVLVSIDFGSLYWAHFWRLTKLWKLSIKSLFGFLSKAPL